MHELIATEHEICSWQFIGREVDTAKLSRISPGVFANESLDDVDAGVFDIEIIEHEPHPIEVAARCIENRFDLEIAQNFHELVARLKPALDRRSRSGCAVGMSPIVAATARREDVALLG